jgi:hypothetical protein
MTFLDFELISIECKEPYFLIVSQFIQIQLIKADTALPALTIASIFHQFPR